MTATRPSRAPHHSPQHSALGRAVRYARAMRGLSQEELGYRANLHRNYVGAIERGEINPTYRVLLKLERGLAIPLSALVAESEELLDEPEPASTSSATKQYMNSTWMAGDARQPQAENVAQESHDFQGFPYRGDRTRTPVRWKT